MISYLADSNALIDLLKAREPLASLLLAPMREQSLALSPITVGEVYEGILQETDASLRNDFEELTGTLRVIAITEDTAREFARLRLSLRRIGQLIPDNDLWIAATALEHELTLATRDAHFDRIDGLKLLRPS